MAGFDNHDRAGGAQPTVDGVGDLRGEALLELWPPGVAVDHPRELRKSSHPSTWDVPYMRLAGEREEMMFTHTRNRQITDEDKVSRLFDKASLEVTGGIFEEAGEELRVSLGDTLGSLGEALPIRFLADG